VVRFLFVLLFALLLPEMAMAADFETLGLTGTQRGIYTVLIFIIYVNPSR